MKSQYNIVKNSYYSSDQYSIESIKKLPYEDNRAFIASILEVEHNTVLRNFKRLVTSIKSQDYVDYSVERFTFYNNYKKKKLDKRMQQSFIKEFSQFSLMADELGIDYSSLSKRLKDLNSHVDSSLSFLKDIANFYRDYNMIESFMRTSMDHPIETAAYIEEIEDLKKQYSHIYDNVENLKNFDVKKFANECRNTFETIKKELIDTIIEVDCSKIYTLGQLYSKRIQEVSGDVSAFLVDKNFEDSIKTRITLTNAQKIQEYILFKDESVAVKKNGVYRGLEDNIQYYTGLAELEESIIQYQLRKKPKLAKMIAQMYDGEHGELDNVLIVIDTFLKNEQILKNMKMDFNIFNHKSFEAIDDYMNELISQHKLQQYANSILSNKNKDLLTASALESFKVLQESGVSKESLQDMIGKKLAALKTPEEFENYLVKVINHFSEFNKDRLTEKLTYANIQPVYDESDVVVFQINNFEQSKLLGSPSWCISRDSHYYNSYTEDDAKQYFMYDFNKNEKDNESMIGFTIYKDGRMSTQHAKNDDYHNVDDYLQKIINKILYKEQKNYELSENKVNELETMFSPKKNKKIKGKISMNINEYMKIIKEVKDKNGVEWNNTIATLAIQKYLEMPAINDFYKNLGTKRSLDQGIPVIYEVKNDQLLSVGHINTSFGEASFEMDTYGAKPSGFKNFLTSETREYYLKLKDTLLNSDNFDDFVQNYNPASNPKMHEQLDTKVRSVLNFSAMFKDYGHDIESGTKQIVYQELSELLNKLNNIGMYQLGVRADNFINFEKGFDDEYPDNYFNAVQRFLVFDELESDMVSFTKTSIEHRLAYYKNIGEQDEFKDSTLLGSVINNPDNFVVAVIDNLVFDEFKQTALFQIKLALKEQTLEQIIENHPIIGQIYNEAVTRSPSLLQSLEERFQHIHITDKEYVEREGRGINFVTAFDNTKLFASGQEYKIIEQQFGYKQIPQDAEDIMATSQYERFVGFDGYSPYYMIMGITSPLTMETDSMLFSGFLVSEALNSQQFYEMFDRLFKICQEREKAFVIENSSFYKELSHDHLKIFSEVKEKYTGIVPTFVMPNDMRKYHSVLKTELNFDQIAKLEPILNKMVMAQTEVKDFDAFFENNVAPKKEGKKQTPKF